MNKSFFAKTNNRFLFFLTYILYKFCLISFNLFDLNREILDLDNNFHWIQSKDRIIGV